LFVSVLPSVCIPGEAKISSRRYYLAQFYDELVRKHWNDRATRGDTGFDVNVECLKRDSDILERAKNLYDAKLPKASTKELQVRASTSKFESNSRQRASGKQHRSDNRSSGWVDYSKNENSWGNKRRKY